MSNTLEHRRRRARRPAGARGPIALGVLVVAFLAVSLPPYLTLDPADSLVPINARVALHYPILVGHIVFGTITLVTACLQLWPWLRNTHTGAHRVAGRLYVVAGMLPSCVLALVIVPMGELNLLGATGASLWAVLGLVTTLRAVRAVLARRYAEHRRWMIYSFSTAMGIVTGRVLFVGLPAVPGVPDAPDVIHPLAGFWLGWMVNLAIAHWWLRRHPEPASLPPSVTARAEGRA